MSKIVRLLCVVLGLSCYSFLLLASALNIEIDQIVFATTSILMLYFGVEDKGR